MKKVKKPKKLTTSQLKKKLDTIYGHYIRRKYTQTPETARCYTCGRGLTYESSQCGHFVSRSHLATRFDEENCRLQCVGCNVFGGGKVAIFATRLEQESPGIVQKLYRKAQEITKDFPYEEKIKEYEGKLKEL